VKYSNSEFSSTDFDSVNGKFVALPLFNFITSYFVLLTRKFPILGVQIPWEEEMVSELAQELWTTELRQKKRTDTETSPLNTTGFGFLWSHPDAGDVDLFRFMIYGYNSG
jgi:hypothetical protein